jgi:hypothetical protein
MDREGTRPIQDRFSIKGADWRDPRRVCNEVETMRADEALTIAKAAWIRRFGTGLSPPMGQS